jgi:alkanesulfonate monooxygenase SsuD/methylene tetrahydromethanopterin reductase-like flavin-dependent oxidoreductase (luciferase family)
VGDDAADSYRFALDMFMAAEELGFDTGWVAQHHFLNGDGRLPSVFPFLGAAAAVTRRIGLGTAIVTLPLEDPIRVAEDAAFVDTLSGGRLQLGLGPGGDPLTFAALGRNVDARREDHARGIQIVRDALVGKPVNGTSAIMYPTSPTLTDRLWEATFSVDGGARIGRNGNGLLLARASAMSRDPADVVQEPIGEAYLREIAGLPIRPRVGMSRTVYAAADRKMALAHMSDGVSKWVKTLVSRGMFPPDLPLEAAFTRSHIHYGHPEEVVASLRADRLFPMATEVICQVQPGAPTQAQILKNLETIAKQVAPALGWQPNRATEQH